MPKINPQPDNRRLTLWLSIATLLSICVWLAINWPHQSLWYDDGSTAWVASGPWSRLWEWTTQIDIQAPLHYIVFKFWITFLGSSEVALHSLSVLCALLGLAGVIALVRRIAGTPIGIATAFLLGFSPGFLWVAYEVRPYGIALALYAWASVIFLSWINPKAPSSKIRWRLLIPYVLLMIALLYDHYTAVGAVASHILLALWTVWQRRSWQVVKKLLLAGLIIGLGFAPWLPVVLLRGTADKSYYPGSIPPDRALGVMLSFKWLARDDFPPNLALYVWGGLALLIVGLAVWLLSKRGAYAVMVGLCLALPPIVIIAAIVYFKPKLAGRYVWASWIGLDMLLALGLFALARRKTAVAACLTVVIIALPWLTGQIGHPPNSDFRDAVAYIQQHRQPDDLVVLHDGTLFNVAEFYGLTDYIGLPGSKITDISLILHGQEAARLLADPQWANKRGVWMLAWQSNVMDPENVVAGLLESVGTEQPVPGSYGDVAVQYFRLNQPLAAISVPDISSPPALTLPGGVRLQSVQLISSGPLHPGDPLIAHGWWWHDDSIDSSVNSIRVSARLVDATGKTVGIMDQPPSGWFYYPDHWPANTLILGRYQMLIPQDYLPGPITLKLHLYGLKDGSQPEITVGTVQVTGKQ